MIYEFWIWKGKFVKKKLVSCGVLTDRMKSISRGIWRLAKIVIGWCPKFVFVEILYSRLTLFENWVWMLGL